MNQMWRGTMRPLFLMLGGTACQNRVKRYRPLDNCRRVRYVSVKLWEQMTSSSKSEVISLDIVRGLAAILVMLVHTRDASFVEYGAIPVASHSPIIFGLFAITRMGREAVLVFFVLSGFLVFGQVVQRAGDGTFDLRRYAVDRLTRILIPLVPACVFTAYITYAMTGRDASVLQLLANMIGLNGIIAPTLPWNAPLWTLAYEIWFYVVGGALGYLIVSRHTSRAAILVLMVCAAIFSILAAQYLLFWMMAGAMTFQLNVRYRGVQAALGTAMWVFGVIVFELGFASKSFANIAVVPQGVAEFLICAGFALALPFLCSDALNRRIAFLSGYTKWLSSVSFSLYLWNYPINNVLGVILPKQADVSAYGVALFGLRIAACVGGSVLAYFLFERYTATARAWCNRLLLKDAKTSAPA
jgi:peptidoglycan/LPS O-acetylase OafA/YrhL